MPEVGRYGHSEAGKGGNPRPFSISQEEYGRRYDSVFGHGPEPDESVLRGDSDADAGEGALRICHCTWMLGKLCEYCEGNV